MDSALTLGPLIHQVGHQGVGGGGGGGGGGGVLVRSSHHNTTVLILCSFNGRRMTLTCWQQEGIAISLK